MVMPKILVTGATGGIGGPLAAELVAKGHPVRAMVRQRDGRSHRLEQLGVEVVTGDLYDPDQVLEALKGTQRAF